MAGPVRARRLTDLERWRLRQIVRRGKHGSVWVRRAMIIMASASGALVPAITRLVAADEDTVREVIHPSQDPNCGDLGEAFPPWLGRDRDAILRPPNWSRPSPPVFGCAADRDADWEVAD
jgi:hypothetical protein